MHKRWLLATAAAAAVVLAYLSLHTPLPAPNGSPALPTAAAERQQKPVTMPPRPVITIDEKQNPRWVTRLADSSLAGSQVDRVQLVTDENGELVLVPGILVYFDYFLSLRGEMAFERIQQIVWDDIHANFSPAIAARLYRLFERYLAYSDAVDAYLAGLTHQQVMAEGITGQQVEQQFQPQFFSDEEIDKLFAGYRKMLDYTPKAAQFRDRMQQYNNTPPAYRFAMATELFGAEAAGRLQALEQQRARWQQRLDDYARQKQQIIASVDLDSSGKQQAVDELLQRSFNARERIRVNSWEIMQQEIQASQ